MTRDQWLAAFAAEVGVAPPSPEEIDALLAVAASAAHASERTAAPLTCWLVGRAGMDADTARAAAARLEASHA